MYSIYHFKCRPFSTLMIMGERAWMCLKFFLLSTKVNYRYINLHLGEYFETLSKHLIYAHLRGQFADIHC